MDPSTTTPEGKLGDGPIGYLEAAATTAIMARMMDRGNGIKNG